MNTEVVRILLVEDSPSDAELLQESLRQVAVEQYEFTCVKSMEQAWSSLCRESFDVLLLDLSLPDSSGPASFVRAHMVAPQMPIVVLTGTDDEALGLEAVRHGVQDYLVKGQADGRQIARSIRYAIERQQVEEALREVRDNLELRVEKRTAELQKSEERFRSLVMATSQMVWTANARGEVEEDIPSWREYTGQTFEQVRGAGWVEAIHPQDRERTLAKWSEAMTLRSLYEAEYRVRGRDGEYRHFTARGAPVFTKDGSLREWVGTCTDITDQKRGEETRQMLWGRLMTAQEEERRRVSRELHDKMGQDLHALLLCLKSLDDSFPTARTGLPQLWTLAEQLLGSVHHLAWELRPPALHQTGVETALQDYVEDWSRNYGLAADFESRGSTENRLPLHIETTLYRITQEALWNVLWHAQATRISVLLERQGAQVLLIVEDNGNGFDPKTIESASSERAALGLVGMQERATLVGGTLEIESAEGTGTTIFVRLPVRGQW